MTGKSRVQALAEGTQADRGMQRANSVLLRSVFSAATAALFSGPQSSVALIEEGRSRSGRFGKRADPREINFDDQDAGMLGDEKPNKRVRDGGGRGAR